ncbi:MAG: hypothetical protein AOY29_13350 [Alcanivorax borkumensis]|nr:hypothetical protein Y017_10440 [Alcanivorax sp. 97CO-5]OJH07628.1 MAG: hypothetical protein AOY29_13350 [Alcanivorax borkumensis]PKG02129.1 hypothetical protein Y019_05370 [Alcanivorax sp. 97CO-6]
MPPFTSSCREGFAQITQIKAIVLEAHSTEPFTIWLLKLNKPTFSVYICDTIAQAKECLLKQHLQE